jgi:hypothetical protein
VFRVEGDGRELFARFTAICRRASIHYEQILPDEFRPEGLVSADFRGGRRRTGVSVNQARHRYFEECFDGSCWIRLPEPAQSSFSPEKLETLFQASREETAEALETRRECDDFYNRLILLRQVLGYAGAKLKFKPEDLGVSSADASELKRDLKMIKRKFAELCSRLERSCLSLMAHLAARLAARNGEIPESWLKTLT